jgi:hypothetical protein
MMNPKALTWAAATTIALIALATIGNELSCSFKQLLSLIGGHHWIGKSVGTVREWRGRLFRAKKGRPINARYRCAVDRISGRSSGRQH